jgi:hypothetical protein
MLVGGTTGCGLELVGGTTCRRARVREPPGVAAVDRLRRVGGAGAASATIALIISAQTTVKDTMPVPAVLVAIWAAC